MNIRYFYIEPGCRIVAPVNRTIQRAIILKGFYLWVVSGICQLECKPAERI
jgi:hypothetical protein